MATGGSGQIGSESPSWLNKQAKSVVQSQLPALLFSTMEKPSQSFVTKNSIRLLNQVRRVLSLPGTSVHTSICFNHFFIPPRSDKTFQVWRKKSLTSIEHLYVNGHFSSCDELRVKKLPHSHHFCYLQIRDCSIENP